MSQLIDENQALFDLLVQVLALIIPFMLAWFVRTYVKSTTEEKRLGSIVRLSNIAIDYAEDLHKRGDLEKYLEMLGLPDEILNHTSSGIQKLNLAGKWLESQLNEMGIKMTDEQAQSWIASEFRQRVGDTGREKSIAQQTRDAVSLLQALEQSGLIDLPTDVERAAQLANKVADWVIEQLDTQDPVREESLAVLQANLTQPQLRIPAPELPLEARQDPVREESLAVLQANLTQPQPRIPVPELPLEARLTELAEQSVKYVNQLKQNHELTMPEADIAVALVVAEVTKQGLSVTTDQIAAAVRAALAESRD